MLKPSALVWTDGGRRLEDLPRGPWTDDFGPEASVLPVIQHYHKMTCREIRLVGSPDTTKLPQSISNLSSEYSSLLSALDLTLRARNDPVSALVPVFTQAADSELSLLNLLSELVEKLTEPTPLNEYKESAFEDLQYYERLVQRQTDQLRRSKDDIKMLGKRFPSGSHRPQSPRPPGSRSPGPQPVDRSETGSERNNSTSRPVSPRPEGALGTHESPFNPSEHQTFSTNGVICDYEDLLARYTRLSARITLAMDNEINRTMIMESHHAIEQTERLSKLTTLATYFLPLSFTASLFGMNFKVLGQGDQPVWLYVVLALPFLLLTHVVYQWDFRPFVSSTSRWVAEKKNKLRRRKEAVYRA